MTTIALAPNGTPIPSQRLILPASLGLLRTRIVRGAQGDTPMAEAPLYSNRSPELDAMCERWQVPLGSYWCAGEATEVWMAAGAQVPPISATSHPWKVPSWYEWAVANGTFFTDYEQVQLGDAALYGRHGKPPCHHIAVCIAAIVRDAKARALYLFAFEGNTNDVTFSANGELMTCKRVDDTEVVGFIRPTEAP